MSAGAVDVLAGMLEVDEATFFGRIGQMNVNPRAISVRGRFAYSDFVDASGRVHGRSLSDNHCVEPTRYAFPCAEPQR